MKQAALIVLPGSKATLVDMAFVREQGWNIDILAHRRHGGAILGLCAGYQMLGSRIAHPRGVEGAPGRIAGLGLLDHHTVLGSHKTLRRVRGTALGTGFEGYEMHIGETHGGKVGEPFAVLNGERPDGVNLADERVM